MFQLTKDFYMSSDPNIKDESELDSLPYEDFYDLDVQINLQDYWIWLNKEIDTLEKAIKEKTTCRHTNDLNLLNNILSSYKTERIYLSRVYGIQI